MSGTNIYVRTLIGFILATKASMTFAESIEDNDIPEPIEKLKDPIIISEKWYIEKGCPKEGLDFQVECNSCKCKETHTLLASCQLMDCPETKVIENWADGKSCEPGEHFFSKCSSCKCDETGKKATCDHRACEYYEPENDNKHRNNEIE